MLYTSWLGAYFKDMASEGKATFDVPVMNIPKEATTRVEVGQTKAREEVEYNEKFVSGKAKCMDRRTMQHGYLRYVTMMNVIVAPFHQSIFSNKTFIHCMNTCREWVIKKCGETQHSAILLSFYSIEEGETARRELQESFRGSHEVSVVPPSYSPDYDLTPNHVNTNSEWVLNECHFGVREFHEAFMKRLILIENVPTCSEAELREEFPEALNVIDFSFDEDCPGMVLIEVYDSDQGTEFIKKYMRHTMKGQRILVDWYMTREKRQSHLQKKWKEKRARQNWPPLEDSERLEKVRRFHQLRESRDKAMLRQDLIGYEKLRESAKSKTEMQELQDHLYFDAKRRYALGADVPEPLSDQLQSVRKLMSGELESAKVANQAITQLDLERQNKERELDVLREKLSADELAELARKLDAGGSAEVQKRIPPLSDFGPPAKRFMRNAVGFNRFAAPRMPRMRPQLMAQPFRPSRMFKPRPTGKGGYAVKPKGSEDSESQSKPFSFRGHGMPRGRGMRGGRARGGMIDRAAAQYGFPDWEFGGSVYMNDFGASEYPL